MEETSIQLRNQKGASRYQTTINYSTLLPEPDHRSSSSRFYLVIGLFPFAAACFFFYLAYKSPDQFSIFACSGVGVMAIVLSLLAVKKYQASRYDLLTFFYLNGSFAFSLAKNNPDKMTFSAFVESLLRKIKDAQTTIPHSITSLTPIAEIEKLGILRDKGLLTDEEFEKTKKSLLDQLTQAPRTIGFNQ
ncbi:MAG: SHOCT domain-containing protein [Luteolibacter sp.]